MRNIVDALTRQLATDIDRKDGASAVRTVQHLRTAAGDEFTNELVNNLIVAGLRRAAQRPNQGGRD